MRAAHVVAGSRVDADVRVAASAEELHLRAAEVVTRAIGDAVHSAGRCSLVLAGGSTPRPLYALLASRFREAIPWDRVHLFWGDERYVAHDHVKSNFRMAKEALLDRVPCPARNVHPMRTDLADPDAAAREYEATLGEFFAGGDPRFDVVLLGLGDDGHMASLFPGSPALDERERWVVAATAPVEPRRRLTLTLPVLARAMQTHFLVTGAGKARVVRRVLTGSADVHRHPAAALARGAVPVTWWLDHDAAGMEE